MLQSGGFSVLLLLLSLGGGFTSARRSFGPNSPNSDGYFLASGQRSDATSHSLPAQLTKFFGNGMTTTVRGPHGVVGIPKAGATVPQTYIVEFADDAEQQIATAHNSKSDNKNNKRSASDVNVHDEFHAFMARSIAEFHGDTNKSKKRDLIDSILRGDTDAGEQHHGYVTKYTYNSPGLFRGVSVKLHSDSYARCWPRRPACLTYRRPSSSRPAGPRQSQSARNSPASTRPGAHSKRAVRPTNVNQQKAHLRIHSCRTS